MLVRTAQKDFRRGRDLRLYVRRHGHEDRVREAELHVEALTIPSVGCPARVVLECGAVADTNQVKRDREALSHTDDSVGDECAREAPHRALVLLRRVLDGERKCVRLREAQAHVWLELDGGRAERACDGNGRRRGRKGDRGWYLYGRFANVGGKAMRRC